MADKLSRRTHLPRRARDVEMAVFTAWGDREYRHPEQLERESREDSEDDGIFGEGEMWFPEET